MKIIIDAFGGDNAPVEIIKGTLQALDVRDDFSVIFTGKKEIIEKEIENNQHNERIEIVDAPEIISNEESPVDAIRKKRDSSLVVALKLLNSDPDIKGFVSAGSTGAVLTGAVLMLKRIQKVQRPALAVFLPTAIRDKSVCLIDCGANADCKPEMFVQFAHMGSSYISSSIGISDVKVGLLNNGVEDGKGNAVVKEASQLLKEEPNLNFYGNIEARDILTGIVDVVVSDGFSGNIALKASEGTAGLIFNLLKNGIKNGGLRAKLGYLFMKPVFKNLKKLTDYNKKGGAVLLGLEKIVVKAHGSSQSQSFSMAVLQAVQNAQERVPEKIKNILNSNK